MLTRTPQISSNPGSAQPVRGGLKLGFWRGRPEHILRKEIESQAYHLSDVGRAHVRGRTSLVRLFFVVVSQGSKRCGGVASPTATGLIPRPPISNDTHQWSPTTHLNHKCRCRILEARLTMYSKASYVTTFGIQVPLRCRKSMMTHEPAAARIARMYFMNLELNQAESLQASAWTLFAFLLSPRLHRDSWVVRPTSCCQTT